MQKKPKKPCALEFERTAETPPSIHHNSRRSAEGAAAADDALATKIRGRHDRAVREALETIALPGRRARLLRGVRVKAHARLWRCGVTGMRQ